MSKLVILDFDGVLVDTELHYPEIHISFFAKYGIPFTEPEVRKMAGRSLLSIMTEMREKHNLSQSPAELKAANIAHIHEYFSRTEIPLMTGAPSLLAHLQTNDIQYCIASSNSKRVIETVLSNAGVKSFFPNIISGDEVKEGKPNPEIFLLAAKKMGFSPADCLVIEDTYNGVQAAKNAKMKCIGFQNPHSGNQDLSDANLIIELDLAKCISLISQ